MSDFSVYPDAIDGYSQLPLTVDGVSGVNAEALNRLRSSIVHIETELGILPSGSGYSTVTERLDSLGAGSGIDIVALEARVTQLELDFATLSSSVTGYKNPARVATSEDETLSGGAPLILGGVTLFADDRVLVLKQDDESENGIYVVQTAGTGSDGTWVRADDSDSSTNLIPGSEIYVIEGTEAGSKFWLITPAPIILGTTALNFEGGLYIMKSDTAPTTIFSTAAIGASEAAPASTISLSVNGFNDIDFSFAVTNLGAGPIAEIRARILFSLLESPGTYLLNPEDWNIMLSEDILSGVSTLDAYTVSLDPTTYPGLTSIPGSFALTARTSGLHMMMLIWSESGDPSGSSFTGIALRKV